MLELIIKNSLDIVNRTERLIDATKRLLGTMGTGIDEIEAYRLHVEIEKLTDVVLVMDEAARLLRRTFELQTESRCHLVKYTVH